MIDAHMPRPGHQLDNWNKILDMLETAYPGVDFTNLQEYREQFCTLTNG